MLMTGLLVGAFWFGSFPALAANATLSLTPASQTLNLNDNFAVEIRLNTSGNAVSAVSAYLNFDTSRLQFVSADYTGSAFDIQAEEVISGNSIKITRGKLPPGVSSSNALVAKVNFKAIASGTANVSFALTSPGQGPSRVIKNDGLGTDILGSILGGNYTVGSPTTLAPTLTLAANPTSITSGQSSSLTWSSSNATSCTASGSWTGSKSTSGSQSVSPTSNATYTLSCTGTGGSVNKSASVSVTTGSVPQVSLDTSSATTNSISLSASFVSSSTVTSKFFQYGTSPTSLNQTIQGVTGSGPNQFNATLTGLSVQTTYYIRPAATNSFGTGFGTAQAINTKTPGTASMSLSPASVNASVNGNFTVEVRLNTGGEAVTAVSAYLSFDNIRLQAVSIDPAGSAFDIEAENVISGNQIKITRGKLPPGVTGSNALVAKINFKGLVSGTGGVAFAGGSAVIKNDGLGTNIFSTGTGGTYTITGTTTPAPTVTLTANPTSITSGQSSSLTWSSTNATSCTASGSWTGSKSTSGSQSVSPTSNATYTLSCTGTGGSVNKSASVTVTSGQNNPVGTLVLNPSTAPRSVNENLTLEVRVNTGGAAATAVSAYIDFDSSKLQFVSIDTAGSAFSIEAENLVSGNQVRITRGQASPGVTSNSASPALLAKVNFKAIGAGTATVSFANGSRIILSDGLGTDILTTATVGSYSITGTTTPTPTLTLTANPASITSGQSSTLTWSSTNATSCTASGGWSGSKSTSGSQSVSPTSNATYTLACTGAGGSVNKSVSVAVAQPAPTDTTPPTVAVSHSPITDLVPTSDITILATATDASGVSSIEIFVDGSSKKVCAASPCSYTSTYLAGPHTYYATGKDTKNNTGRNPTGTQTKSFNVAVPSPLATMSLSPSSQSLQVNNNLALEVRLNTGGNQVTAVSSYLNFDTSKLQFVSIDATGSAFSVQAEGEVAGNQVKISRGQAAPGVTGSNVLVAKVNFKAIATGTANVSFAMTAAGQGPSRVIKSDGLGTDILSTTTGGAYTITSAGSADTSAPTVSVSHSPTSGILPTISITLTATATDNVGVSNIEIFVDNASKKTCTSSPCTYTGTFGVGNHTYYAVAKDAAGNTGRDPGGTATKSFSVTSPSTTGGNAVFFLVPNARTVNIGEIFTLEVRLNTGGKPVVSASAHLTYDSSKLQLTGIDSASSQLTIKAEETTDGNLIKMSRGNTTPLNNGSVLFAKLNFKAIAAGAAAVDFSLTLPGQGPTRVITNDGAGTDILGLVMSSSYTINTPASGGSGGSSGGSGSGGSSGGSGSGVVLPPNTQDGDVIKFPTSSTIYLVKPDGLYPFDTSASYQSYVSSSGEVLQNRSETNPAIYTIKSTPASTILGQSGSGGSGGTTGSSGRPSYNHLIKYPDGATVYVIENGVKRPISSFDVYLKDFASQPIAVVATSVTYPTGATYHYGSGALLKTSRSAAVYLIIDNGTKYLFKSAEEFLRFGFRFDRVRVVDEAILDSYTNATISSLTYHAKNQFIKYPDSPTVYLIENYTKRPIRTPAVFFSWTNSFDDVFTIDRSFNYPDGPLLGFKNGSIIKGSPATVYLIDNNKKRGFTSAQAYFGLGYSFSQVRAVPDDELNLHEQGTSF